ncbi:MAG: hypothetical protein NC177_02585 [Ruminococcus flavefaciens]|nr:hypothetical protein [Ruminococcus flavefaciens]
MRKITKSAVAFSAVFSAVMCIAGSSFTATAYDAPQDIHLSIETKEIDINDIPENRVISLEIHTENCPPYSMLSFLIEKDSRLEYLPYTYLSDAEQVSNMGGMSFELGSSELPDVIMCNIPALINEKIDYNGLIVRANVILPEDVKAGEFYSLNFKRTFFDTYELETSIMLENDFDAVFGNDSFSQLNGGGILITQAEVPPPEVPPESPQEEIPEETQPPEQETEAETEPQVTETTESITSETTTVSTVSETTSSATVTSSTTETVLTKESSSSSSSISETETTSEAVSETTTTATVVSEKKKSTHKPLIIAISAILVAVATGTVIFIKRKRK